MVTDRAENIGTELETKGQAKLLGECKFDLDTILASLIDSVGVGVKKALKFTRMQGDKTVTVGRFVVDFQIAGDYNAGEAEGLRSGIENRELKAMADIDRVLPACDFGLNKWRVRIDARCAVGCPLNLIAKDGFPSMFMQIGWSQYKHEEPSTLNIVETSLIEENRHPIWNEQILLNNPGESDKPSKSFRVMVLLNENDSWILMVSTQRQEPHRKYNGYLSSH